VPVPLIEYRNVTVRREDNVALDNLNLSIYTGEHVAILGPNGSGKSSLIKTITREVYPLLKPDSWLKIRGEELFDVFELRAQLGIVTNDLMRACTRNYSGLEIVVSGFFSSVGIWPNHHVTKEMLHRGHEVLELLEVPHLAARNTDEMSSGEAHRILIARALVHDPKALILDEPSSSLDFRAQHELRQILSKLARSGTGIVLVTHHLPDIIPEIERVILIDRGRVVRDGAKAEILTSEALGEMFHMPVTVVERGGYYQIW